MAGRVTAIALTCFLLGSETTEDFEESCAKVGLEEQGLGSSSRHKANWVGWVRVTAIALTCFLLGFETTEVFEENCAKVGLED